MSDTAIGEFVTQICSLCGGKIAHSDALYPGLVHRLDFGAVSHHSCYQARYHSEAATVRAPEPVQGQLDLFDTPEPSGATPGPPVSDSTVSPVGAVEGRYYLWVRDDSRRAVAQIIADAVALYADKFGHEANVVYAHEADWRRSGVTVGEEVIPGVRLFVSGFVHEFEFKVGKE